MVPLKSATMEPKTAGSGASIAHLALLLLTAGITTACGRSELGISASLELDEGSGGITSSPTEDEADGSAAPPPTTMPTSQPTAAPAPPECQEESCNGRDDDCNGAVDDVAPVPCPGGGERYCIAGRLSECPVRCEGCLPGSERVCFKSYCTYWGAQTCAADGRTFGVCREHQVPGECEDIAFEHKDSPELEQCCIDNGYCCLDSYDLDGDGDRRDMIGQCDEVLCISPD